jgi:hypothetical protein
MVVLAPKSPGCVRQVPARPLTPSRLAQAKPDNGRRRGRGHGHKHELGASGA